VDLPPLRSGASGRADVLVRPARLADAGEIARVQIATWRTAYGALLPPTVLADWDDATATASWAAAIHSPPTPGHRVLVAEESGTLVGFAASGPAEVSPTETPFRDGPTSELSALLVEPPWGRRGHGSRLLAAVVDLARTDGVARLVIWLPEADRITADFLAGAGWDRDGWVRSLDTGTKTIRQVRWHTLLEERLQRDERGAE
jgi:GNAT superfamily N-acetyltransferase